MQGLKMSCNKISLTALGITATVLIQIIAMSCLF